MGFISDMLGLEQSHYQRSIRHDQTRAAAGITYIAEQQYYQSQLAYSTVLLLDEISAKLTDISERLNQPFSTVEIS